MRIRLGVDPDIDTDTMGEAIDAALEASAISQVPLIERGKIPDIRKAIKAGKVRWQPEPPGDEHFDDAKTVLQRGWGDCDDLAPWLAATLRATGEAPDARPFVYQSGPRRWHAVVDRGDGKVLDPSKWAGMGGKKKRIDGIGAAAWLPMVSGNLALATYPYVHGYAGRVDLPDQELPLSWSVISRGNTQARAVVGALRGVQRIAEIVGEPYEEDIARLQGLDVLLTDGDSQVVGDVLGALEGYLGEEGLEGIFPAAQAFGAPLLAADPEVGSFLSKAFKSVTKVANPFNLAQTVTAKIPGMGGVAKGMGAFMPTNENLLKYGPMAAKFAPGGAAGSAAFEAALNMAKQAQGGRPSQGAPQGPFIPPPPTGVTSMTADALRQETQRAGTTLSMPGGVVIVRF
jgi:hypothetical protein